MRWREVSALHSQSLEDRRSLTSTSVSLRAVAMAPGLDDWRYLVELKHSIHTHTLTHSDTHTLTHTHTYTHTHTHTLTHTLTHLSSSRALSDRTSSSGGRLENWTVGGVSSLDTCRGQSSPLHHSLKAMSQYKYKIRCLHLICY